MVTLALRTYAVAPGPALCPLFELARPVTGILEGDPAAREPVWLEGPDGEPISVEWPAGFSARFSPHLVLLNEKGVAVARAGQTVTLPQVAPRSHAGTYADPYLAQGLLFGSCYVPAR